MCAKRATAVVPPANWKRGFSRGDDGYFRFQRTYGGPTVGIKFEPRDIWVGVYWNRDPLMAVDGLNLDSVRTTGYFWTVYICLLPCLPIRFGWIQEL